MELVEDDGADAREARVGEQAAREHALGDEPEPRARPAHALEAHGEADRAAEGLAPLVRDAPRHPRGEAAGLEDEDLAVADGPRVEERRGDARRLPRARRRLEDEPPRRPPTGDEVGQQRIDGERAEGHAPMPPRRVA